MCSLRRSEQGWVVAVFQTQVDGISLRLQVRDMRVGIGDGWNSRLCKTARVLYPLFKTSFTYLRCLGTVQCVPGECDSDNIPERMARH